jgi:hypothetical protein
MKSEKLVDEEERRQIIKEQFLEGTKNNKNIYSVK